MVDIPTPNWNPQVALQAGQNQPAPFNPLASYGSMVEIQRNQLALRQQQMELAARQAVGRDYQGAINPLTGQLDPLAFNKTVAGDSDAALGAVDAGSTSLAQQGQQTQNASAAIALQHQKIGVLIGLAAPLAADPNVTKADVATQIQHAVQTGHIDQATADSVVQTLPAGGPPLQKALGDFINGNLGAEGQYSNVYGSPSTVTNGPNVLAGTTASPAQGGGFTPSTATPLGIGPDAAAAQQPGVDAQGRPTLTPLGARLPAQGQAGLVAPGPTAPVGSAKYPWNSAGSPPPAAAPPPAQAAQPAPPAPAPVGTPATQPPPAAAPTPPTGATVVGMAPGDADAMAATKTAGAQDSINLMRAASDSPNRKALLNNMEADLSNFSSGSGYQTMRKGLAVLNNILPINFDEGGIESSQGFNKLANQLAASQSTALGVGTDAKLEATMHANPNASLQTGTNQQIIHTLLGNEDAINAKATAWQNSGQPAASYQSWSQNFNQTFDPRVFQMLRMSPEERTNMQAEMQKAGTLGAFKSSVNAMAQQGLLPSNGN